MILIYIFFIFLNVKCVKGLKNLKNLVNYSDSEDENTKKSININFKSGKNKKGHSSQRPFLFCSVCIKLSGSMPEGLPSEMLILRLRCFQD